MNVIQIFEGSDGDLTKRLYAELESIGPVGQVAMNLFRAQKASTRAKVYRGGNLRGRYSDQAYAKKQWSMDNLCAILSLHADGLGIVWGWGQDLKQTYHNQVLYVELPNGQVSFHTSERGQGPDYGGTWDRSGNSAGRILTFCQAVLNGRLDSLTRIVRELSQDDSLGT